MTLYTKLACAAVKIERKDLRSEKFIRACMGLLREYKVQVLAAIIEDEGSIKPKSGNIRIAMKDYEIMKAIGELIDDLGYERSNIIKINNHGFKSDKESFLYGVRLKILGSHKLHDDIKSAINKYGELAGLWKKQKQLEELIQLNDGRKAKGAKINDVLSIKTINLMKENNNFITCKRLRQILCTSHHRTGSIVRRLYNKGIISKNERGHYTLLNQSGNDLKN